MCALRRYVPRANAGAHPLLPGCLLCAAPRSPRRSRPRKHASAGGHGSSRRKSHRRSSGHSRTTKASSTGSPTTTGSQQAPARPRNSSDAVRHRHLGRAAHDSCADARPYRSRRREASVQVAELIPGAKAVQLPGEDTTPWADDEAPPRSRELPERSGHDARSRTASSPPSSSRTSSVRPSAPPLGDSAWRDLLARHHTAVRRELARFRGQELDTAGDGFFASLTGQRAPLAAPRRSSQPFASWSSTSARGCTPASASYMTRSSRESPSASGREWPAKRSRGPSSSPAR